MDAAAIQSLLTVQNITVFVLAIFVGYHVVWNVTPALHTPLMAVTNAISGIIIVGALLQTEIINGDEITLTSLIGALAVFLASINIFGGFMVTRRSGSKPPGAGSRRSSRNCSHSSCPTCSSGRSLKRRPG